MANLITMASVTHGKFKFFLYFSCNIVHSYCDCLVIPKVPGYTKSARLYRMFQVIPKVPGYTKKARLYQISQVIPNVPGYTE